MPIEATAIYSDEYTKKRVEDGSIILEKTLRTEVTKESVLERLQENLDNFQREKAGLDARIAEIQAKIATITKIT
jgi:hypothetical protein